MIVGFVYGTSMGACFSEGSIFGLDECVFAWQDFAPPNWISWGSVGAIEMKPVLVLGPLTKGTRRHNLSGSLQRALRDPQMHLAVHLAVAFLGNYWQLLGWDLDGSMRIFVCRVWPGSLN